MQEISHEIVGAVQIPHPQRMEIKFPTPWKTLIIKFPPPRDGKGVKCPGFARGGMLKLRFDRYIIFGGGLFAEFYLVS